MTSWPVTGNSTFPVIFTTTTTYPLSITWIGSLSEPESEVPMSNVTTLAQLEAIPIDRMVRVDGIDWKRTEKGLMRDDVDLALFHFEGRVNSGAVVDLDGLPPAAGEWWGGSTRFYYLNHVDDRRVYYSSFRSNGTVYNWVGDSRRQTWEDSTTLHRLTGAPSVLENSGLASAAVAYGELRSRYRTSEEARAEAVRQAAELRNQVARQARKPRDVLAHINSIRHNLDQIAHLMEE